jgi:hypothetical protein
MFLLLLRFQLFPFISLLLIRFSANGCAEISRQRNSEIKTSYFIRLSFSNTIYYFLKVNEAFKEIRAEAFAKRSVAISVICSLLLP